MSQETKAGAVPLIGAWKLITSKIDIDDGRVMYPFGEDALGSIIFTESGRFAAQIMRRNRPKFASGDQLKGTPDEVKAGFEGFFSTFGSFELNSDEAYLVLNFEGSLFPNWEGASQKRIMEFKDGQLILTTPPIQWGGGGEIVVVLIWERIGT